MIRLVRDRVRNILRGRFRTNGFPNLDSAVIELNSFNELKKVFSWNDDPILDRPDIYEFRYVEDVNGRRVRDAESLATVIRNSGAKTILEIGTSDGKGTVLLAANAPEAQVHTVNIPPEEILAGEGGKLTTWALEREKIGIAYRERGLDNVHQIYANTATWEPDIGDIDVAFIDGCHDADFVYSDTRKVLKRMKPGAFVMWHDFNPELANKFHWIREVCCGVERLFAEGLLTGRVFHIRDSWVGIYRVGG